MTIANFDLKLVWNNVILVQATGRVYEYAEKFTPYIPERYARPAVYKWFVHPAEAGKQEQVYIGEAESLIMRVQRGLTPAKTAKRGDTNARLKAIFDCHLAAHRHVSLATLDFSPFELGGVLFTNDHLSNVYVRRTLENLSLCDAEAKGQELLNKAVENPGQLVQKFRELPPHQQRMALRRASD
ncbi:MAG TPA: hypothetical protein VNJ52_04625 [Patescibacteria group bacterium]|nr:hypothetical protein [Patescibacteria group bacterium]